MLFYFDVPLGVLYQGNKQQNKILFCVVKGLNILNMILLIIFAINNI